MSLSVCLIVKDEEAVIARCLNCAVKFADEIIVVDTGSADATVEEARKFTDDIYFYEWKDDFASARNFAFEQATCDYVMWLDADDVVTDGNCRKIKELAERADFDMAFLRYGSAFEGDAPTFVYCRERIFKRSKNYRFSGAVHEAVAPAGKIVYSDAMICHKKVKEGDPLRNLRIYQKQIARGICLNERDLFYYGRELLFCGMTREGIAVLEQFLLGGGWVENKKEACLNLFRAYMGVNDEKRAYGALLKSFLYASPTSEACCILGDRFFAENELNSAIYWYLTAVSVKPDVNGGAFVNLDYSGYIPYLQLCVIYDRLGDYERASYYNELAGKEKPNGKSFLANREYFKRRIEK